MGVYSDVAIICQEPVFNRFKQVLENKCVPKPRISTASSTYSHLPKLYLIQWFSIKWYDEFDYVQLVNGFVEAECSKRSQDIGDGIAMFEVIEESETGAQFRNFTEGMPYGFYPQMMIKIPDLNWERKQDDC